MMARVLAFIKYHNALPIGLSFLLLFVSGALAASPELRNDLSKGVVSATESLIAIDNSYIASVDLETYTPRIEIKNVTEDETSYYVEYVLTTIDLADGVWRDVGKEETMNVAKDALGGQDLGLYVTRQLAEVSDAEMERLLGTQQFERQNGVTQKTVATAYSGLIGKYLDPKEEVLPGYTPVIPEPELAPTEPGIPLPSYGSSSCMIHSLPMSRLHHPKVEFKTSRRNQPQRSCRHPKQIQLLQHPPLWRKMPLRPAHLLGWTRRVPRESKVRTRLRHLKR